MPIVYKTLGQVVVGSTKTGVMVTNKAITTNVATLTTAAAHNFSVGDVVLVNGVDTTFDGSQVVASIPTSTTFTFRSATATVASAAVSPNASAVRTHNHGGVVSSNIYHTGANAVITTASSHGLSPNDWVYVTCGSASTDGLVKVVGVPSTTLFTYAKVGVAVASTAVTNGAIGRAIPSSWTSLYTVPADTRAILSTLSITNQNITSANYRVALSATTTPTQSEILVFDGTVNGQDTITLTLGLVVLATTRIMVNANAPDVSFAAFGVEYS